MSAAGCRPAAADAAGLSGQLDAGAGALLVTEEGLSAPVLEGLTGWAETTPDWCALPLIVLLRDVVHLRPPLQRFLSSEGQPSFSVRVLNRPCHPQLLESALMQARLSRARQYRIRDQIEEIARSRDHIEMLAREVQHRAKNNIARISALLDRTRRYHADPDDLVATAKSRIGAMARAQDLLDYDLPRGTTLETLIANEIAAARPDGQALLSYDGDELLLRADAGLALHMTFHELATNAVKYGALSVPGGSVTAHCATRMNGEGKIADVLWQERGGPPAAEPQKTGFGSKLIGQLIAHELGGDAEIGYAREGLSCRLTLPLERIVAT